MKTAIIAGSGLDEYFSIDNSVLEVINTRFGETAVYKTTINNKEAIFLPRHGIYHNTAPAQINYRAQIAALKCLDVKKVIGICAVGSLSRDIVPGSFVVLSDFIDLTKKRIDTFFDIPESSVVHTDFSEPYCPVVSKTLMDACLKYADHYKFNAVYIGVEGPRYETASEIKLYNSWGADVIGMTNVPECGLAKEAGLCYGGLGIVTNYGTGLSKEQLSHTDVIGSVNKSLKTVMDIINCVLDELPDICECNCSQNNSLII